MRLGRLAADHEGAGEVGLDHLAPLVGGELHERLAVLDPGIVDDDVDRNALSVEAVEGCDDCGLVGDIESGAFGLVAGGAKFGGGLLHALGIDAVDDDPGTGLGHALCDGAAEAAGGAGHERGAAGKVEEGGAHLKYP
ncbi:hypothetical protein ACVWZZ_000355 [Bradyrhizobium sp. LM6.10]